MWNDLTMQQRADIISMAVKAGIRDMNSIRSFYDESVGSRRFDDGGLFGNEAVDTVASFLPILGTAEDAYQFYKDPSWANAGWLALSLGSDIFTGGMASRAVKAARMASKAVKVANAEKKAARATWNAGRRANMNQSGSVKGADMRRMIERVKSANDNANAAIRRAKDAQIDAAIKTVVDQGTNAFLNSVQLDLLPDLSEYAEGGSIHIAPSKRGTFTAAATKHGMGVQEFASKVLAHPENYSLTMRKKANFARNASKWKH